jgi:hypothetical protein
MGALRREKGEEGDEGDGGEGEKMFPQERHESP